MSENPYRKKKREGFFKRTPKKKLFLYATVGYAMYYGFVLCQKPWLIYKQDNQNADNFAEYLKNNCSNLTKRFCPTIWLPNGHLQTIYGAKYRHIIDDEDEKLFIKKRKQYEFENNITINLDWFEPSNDLKQQISEKNLENTKKATIFILPGLSGGTNAVGVRHLVYSFVKRGYKCVVMDYRSPHKQVDTISHTDRSVKGPLTPESEPISKSNPSTTSGNITTTANGDNVEKGNNIIPGINITIKDMRNVVQLIRKDIGKEGVLVPVGLSLGGNILLTYLAENVGKGAPKIQGAKKLVNQSTLLPDDDGDESRNEFDFAITIGNPFNLNAATNKLRSNFFQRLIYDKAYCEGRKQLYIQNKNLLPEEYRSKLDNINSSRDLDDLITKNLAVDGPFKTLEEFYDHTSCYNKLNKIQIPTVCINTLDDPVADPLAIPYESFVNHNKLMLVTTLRGGHIASLDGFLSPHNKESWTERTTVDVVNNLLEWRRQVKGNRKVTSTN
ncbi:hypothetical protein ABK040_016570 [Willaertia magna]